MTQPPGPHAAELLRRVRAWNVSSWRHGSREVVVRAALDSLARLAQASDGRPRPPVPDAGLHALADQLHVLLADAETAGADADAVHTVLIRVSRQLGLPL